MIRMARFITILSMTLPLLFSPSRGSADSLTLTTYYPAPHGAYDRLRLVPRANIAAPCPIGMLYVNSQNQIQFCQDDGQGAGTWGPVPGVWTQHTVPVLGDTSVFVINDSAALPIYVGIGTSAPTSRLQIVGEGATNATSSLNVTDSAAKSLFFVRDDGKIGIGTTSPSGRLQIHKDSAAGLENFSIFLSDYNVDHGMTGLVNKDVVGQISYLTDGIGGVRLQGFSEQGTGISISGISSSSVVPSYDKAIVTYVATYFDTVLQQRQSFPNAALIHAFFNDTAFLVGILGNGYVGIGTTAPNEQLELTGNLRLPVTTATTGIIFAGASRFIHNFGTSNIFLGSQSGNLSMSGGNNTAIGNTTLTSNTTGANDTAVGFQALANNTDGAQNTAIGANALRDNSTGGNNTAIGLNALSRNTSGGSNIALGSFALDNNTSGEENMALGYNALYNNAVGNYNTAIGRDAGYNSIGHSNVFLGYQAGYNENGSNKLYIDNSNTATPLIYGDFSTNELTINGTVKITGGTPGVNKVLTSDVNGLASWQASAGGGSTGGLLVIEQSSSVPANRVEVCPDGWSAINNSLSGTGYDPLEVWVDNYTFNWRRLCYITTGVHPVLVIEQSSSVPANKVEVCPDGWSAINNSLSGTGYDPLQVSVTDTFWNWRRVCYK